MKRLPSGGRQAGSCLLALLGLGLGPSAPATPAAGDDGPTAWTHGLQFWVYGTQQPLYADSVLNPGDGFARLPSNILIGDLRLDAKYRQDGTELVFEPRALAQRNRAAEPVADSDPGSVYLAEGFARWHPAETTITIGRDRWSWGPASFRSPSSPFYFDAGKTNPLRDVSGIDLARVTIDRDGTLWTGAYVWGSGHDQPGPADRDTAVAKADWHSRNAAGAIAIARQSTRGPTAAAPFLGAYGQITPSDAWLIYGEYGSGRVASALAQGALPAGGGLPWHLTQPSPRAAAALAGASYTLENGQTVEAEMLHDGHGLRSAEEATYFSSASQAAGELGRGGPANAAAVPVLLLLNGEAPRLLSRCYAYLQWHSNPNEGDTYWQTSWTANLQDHSGQAGAYAERSLNPRVTGFLSLAWNQGRRASEFGAYGRGSATLGVKFFLD